MKHVLLLCFLLVSSTREYICLRIVSISVPSLKALGESATLSCEYSLEGGRLYAVKWYRDHSEFYRYMPRLTPPQHSHLLDGVTVDLHKSSARRVHLKDLTLRSRGLYRCEVSEEAPSFHSEEAEAFLEVYYFPREAPRVSGHDRRYDLNEPLDVNCTSAKAFPAPDLQWHVDGQKVNADWLTAYETSPATQGLQVSTLGLRAPAKPRMRLRCVATIGTHKRERSVVIVSTWMSCREVVFVLKSDMKYGIGDFLTDNKLRHLLQSMLETNTAVYRSFNLLLVLLPVIVRSEVFNVPLLGTTMS